MVVAPQSIDLAVIGGGLVGLATAYQYLRAFPGAGVVVLEKEEDVCRHQSGRNSGVIHSGIYYKPGSLKARNCLRGKALLEEFCTEHNLPWKRTGKVIVASSAAEIPRLETLLERGRANGVPVERISQERLKEIEPAVAGVDALYVSSTGVVDFKAVAYKLRELIVSMGGQVVCSAEVKAIDSARTPLRIVTTVGDFESERLVNCAGLYSDKILELCGEKPEMRIVPFRGDYYFLTEAAAGLCRTLIYPVPNPDFPFLGVHFTRGVHGEVDCGPNAVLAFAREGYTLGDINLRELWESLSFVGFRRLVRSQWREAARELSVSISKARFVRAAQRLVPDVTTADLVPAPSGVRAQAVSPDGRVIDDFVVRYTPNAVHILNAPSPAATSCLSIGLTVVQEALSCGAASTLSAAANARVGEGFA
jgi:L-2-hydroxyglutarate oxidase LhgO